MQNQANASDEILQHAFSNIGQPFEIDATLTGLLTQKLQQVLLAIEAGQHI